MAAPSNALAKDLANTASEIPFKVPFVDLKRVSALIREPALAAWEHALTHTEFVGGPTVSALEKTLGSRLGAQHVITCSSGTDALYIALQALGVGPGKKVALPNLTFWATYEAVAQLGATPVLIDIDPADLQIDFDEFKQAFEKVRFDAAILVHLMGWAMPHLGELRKFCRENGIALLEDGAQSYGVAVGGRSVYEGAQVSTLSFYPAKVVGGCMDGGAILTDDAGLAELVRKLCNHGRATHYTYSHIGWNSRMGGISAGWLAELLRHDQAILSSRRELEASYRRFFTEELADHVTPYGPPAGVQGNGYLSVCTLKNPGALDAVTARLSAAGVSVGRVYPETLDMQPPAAGALRFSGLEKGRAFCQSVINLPLFYGMTTAELERAQQVFAQILGEVA